MPTKRTMPSVPETRKDRPLRVYGWLINHRDERDPHEHHCQSRVIVAAKSAAAAARIVGAKRPSQIWNMTETRNEQEVRKANERPGIVLFRGLDVWPSNTEYLALPRGVRAW